MSHERQPNSNLFQFEFMQPGGSVTLIDFSAPGERGDFAFYDTSTSRNERYYYAYHTGASEIFHYFLAVLASQANAEHQLHELEHAVMSYERTLTPTSESESSFSEYDLAHIRQLAIEHPEPTAISVSASGYGDDSFSLIPSEDATTCQMMRAWDEGETLTYDVQIPHTQAWQFLAGMTWRTYGEDGDHYSMNSRHSSQAYVAALGAFGAGLVSS